MLLQPNRHKNSAVEFLALKWAITEQFHDYLYYAPTFMVYTDNNSLSYVLTTAKLNATGLRWIGELVDYNFKIQNKSGKLNTDADRLSRLPADFKEYMDSCSETISPERLRASVAAVRTM